MDTAKTNINIADMPHIGVIIPCHNHAQYVDKCIMSVIKEEYPNKSIVVINDGSSDDSAKVVTGLMQDCQKKTDNTLSGHIGNTPIILFNNEQPHGPSYARNVGFSILGNSAHVFAPIDADDCYMNGKLFKSMVELSKDIQRIGLVYSDVIIYNELKNHYTYEYRQPYSRRRLEVENIISNAPLINKIAINQVGGYDESLRTCEDWDLWLRITEYFVAIHIPEPLQMYRVTGKNATHTVNMDQWRKDFQTVQLKLRSRKQQ